MSEHKRSFKRSSTFIALVALMSGFGGLLTAQNCAAASGAQAAIQPVAYGMESTSSAADAELNAAWMAWRFSNIVNATPEQKLKLIDISKNASKDIYPLRQRMQELRRQVVDLLRKPGVNRDELEKIRQEAMNTAEAVSKRATQALGDIGDTLTEQQRQNLAADISFLTRHFGRIAGMERKEWMEDMMEHPERYGTFFGSMED